MQLCILHKKVMKEEAKKATGSFEPTAMLLPLFASVSIAASSELAQHFARALRAVEAGGSIQIDKTQSATCRQTPRRQLFAPGIIEESRQRKNSEACQGHQLIAARDLQQRSRFANDKYQKAQPCRRPTSRHASRRSTTRSSAPMWSREGARRSRFI